MLLAVTVTTAVAVGEQITEISPLRHARLEEAVESLVPGPDSGFRFLVLGDQRAIPDGERRDLVWAMDSTARATPRVLFFIDTGDIVGDGRRPDQFGKLSELIAPLARLPYLVGVGNHEVSNNRTGDARAHLAAFLAPLDSALEPHRLYYRKDIGPVRFLFLETSDLVYGDRGDREGDTSAPAGSRAMEQLEWLAAELGDSGASRPPVTVVVMHHPFVQSSKKHLAQARALWHYQHDGRTLPDLFADGGVTLVLTGHTHTYERFTMTRADGRAITVINVSGRPRPSFLFFGAGARRARDLSGHEREWLEEKGWTLDGWTVVQDEAMTEDESNQYALVEVSSTGAFKLTTHRLGYAAGTPSAIP